MKYRPRTGYLLINKTEEYEQAAATSARKYAKEEFQFKKDKPPACVVDILNGGWKKDGDRNQATVQLACYFKDAGYTREETMKELEDWVLKFTSEDNEYGKQQRVANTRSVIDAVYSGDNTYKFGCAFIRSLHGEKKPGSKDYERVACAGDMCHCIKKNAEEEENAKLLHLAETGNADLTGKLVKHVSWLQEKAYALHHSEKH